MPPDFPQPARTLCLLRLSALGDITHTLPIFYTLRENWPDTRITWIIGKVEYELVRGIKDVEFIIFDKKQGLKAYLQLYQQLKTRRFDILLHMQMSLRASIASLLVRAPVRIGFDRQRAKDGQWLFSNKKIAYQPGQHVIDSFFGFSQALGIQDKQYRWDIPIPETDRASAQQKLGIDSPYVIISPCSSKAYRNWSVEGYAEVARYLREKYQYSIVITGGNSDIEHQYADNIQQRLAFEVANLVGKTSIKELLAIIEKADFMISPDSGPAHMATAMNTPVIGLYACTNPDRARPYLSEKWLVNRYPEAIQKKYNKPVSDVPWGARVRDDWAMLLITVDDVIAIADKLIHSPLTNSKNALP